MVAILQVPILVRSDLVFNERLTEFSVDICIDEEEIKTITFDATNDETEILIKLECMCDEQPWNWGNAAKTIINGIVIE